MNDNQLVVLIEKVFKNGLGTPVLIVTMLAMVVLPLPPFLLDLFFTFNIAFALVVLLAGVYAQRPLDFAVFPTVILLATLLRLGLNIASTRIVLLNGHTGTDAAGQVIKSFGEVVIGGNYTVGLVVFAILVVINFVVVTKGAGRVSEVSARFTLDALPGKQMAIDADLSSGIINQDEARLRREEIAQEADFYGSMDGASKFVRGDAIAGILILIINIVGGIIIGTAQHNMSIGDAVHNYVLLTIGDGLVAQVPSLVLSTAAAIMVTRISKSHDMGSAVITQVFGNPRSLMISAGVIAALGVIPGMPHIAFLLLASGFAGAAYYASEIQKQRAIAQQMPAEEAPIEAEEAKEFGWDDVKPVDIIGLEVGYRLISMVDESQGGQLLGKLKGVRKKVSSQLGFLIPAVHIRDNLDLPPNQYVISVSGVTSGQGEIFPDKFLAINPGQVFSKIDGISTVDPAYGLEAVWIEERHREHAQGQGYTVVDPSTVVATHFSKVLAEQSSSLCGYEEVQQLLDKLKDIAPKLVDELIPEKLSLGTVVRVLQNLLSEKVNIRDLRTIAETLAEQATRTTDPEALTGAVRVALGRHIVQSINKLEEELPIITLQPELEQLLQNSLQAMNEGQGSIEPGLAEQLSVNLKQIAEKQEIAGAPAVLVVQPDLRQLISRFTRSLIPYLHVLSYQEIPDNKQIRIVGAVG